MDFLVPRTRDLPPQSQHRSDPHPHLRAAGPAARRLLRGGDASIILRGLRGEVSRRHGRRTFKPPTLAGEAPIARAGAVFHVKQGRNRAGSCSRAIGDSGFHVEQLPQRDVIRLTSSRSPVPRGTATHDPGARRPPRHGGVFHVEPRRGVLLVAVASPPLFRRSAVSVRRTPKPHARPRSARPAPRTRPWTRRGPRIRWPLRPR